MLGILFADRVNRKRLIVGLSVLIAALGFAYPFAAQPALVIPIGLVLVTAVYFLVGVSWACYLPESFPTDVRLRASGLCNAVGRIAAAILPFVAVRLLATSGVIGVVSLVGAVLLLQAVVVTIFGIDTNSRPLEALENPALGDALDLRPSMADSGGT